MIRRLAITASLLWSAPTWADDGDLGVWEAFLAMGEGAPGDVVRRTDAARDSLVAATALSVDTDSLSLMQRVREAALELDLGDLYGMLPWTDPVHEQLRRLRMLRMSGI